MALSMQLKVDSDFCIHSGCWFLQWNDPNSINFEEMNTSELRSTECLIQIDPNLATIASAICKNYVASIESFWEFFISNKW